MINLPPFSIFFHILTLMSKKWQIEIVSGFIKKFARYNIFIYSEQILQYLWERKKIDFNIFSHILIIDNLIDIKWWIRKYCLGAIMRSQDPDRGSFIQECPCQVSIYYPIIILYILIIYIFLFFCIYLSIYLCISN